MSNVTSPEVEQKGRIALRKVDSKTGLATSEGSASLKNAIYDVFLKSAYGVGDNTESASKDYFWSLRCIQ